MVQIINVVAVMGHDDVHEVVVARVGQLKHVGIVKLVYFGKSKSGNKYSNVDKVSAIQIKCDLTLNFRTGSSHEGK